jgi:kinesin family member 17
MGDEAVKVIVRCRPQNKREKDLNCKSVIRMNTDMGLVQLLHPSDDSPPKDFSFDSVYYDEATNRQIYEDMALPLVDAVLQGYNATVFAYGQTGCGKTFTMSGIPEPPEARGITPNAFEQIFEEVSMKANAKFLIQASYLEIYNEEIRDLLSANPNAKCDLREHPDHGVYVQGLSQHNISSAEAMQSTMDKGYSARTVGATLMNAESSRSHSIFTIVIETMETRDDGTQAIRKGKLNLVDLAGSERQSKTGATGDRLKEATKINLSLSALGNVISALVDGKATHIPYRDSKLTRMLQDSLGGNTKTLMVACVSPADNNYDETLSTLRYANRAKNIKNKPTVNEDPKDALLRKYEEEIERLKKLLAMQGMDPAAIALVFASANGPMAGAGPAGGPGAGALTAGTAAAATTASIVSSTSAPRLLSPTEDEESALRQLREEYEARLYELQALHSQDQEENERLQSELATLQSDYESKLDETKRRFKQREREAGTASDAGKGGATEGASAERTLERLRSLEQAFVTGGARAADATLKEKMETKLKRAELKKLKLREALAHAEDQDGVIEAVYDSVKVSIVERPR